MPEQATPPQLAKERMNGRELVDVGLLMLNVFAILVAYYIAKTVREPLVLQTGGAELKSYAAALQALALIAYVPIYAKIASAVPRRVLNVGLTAFFVVCLQMFRVLGNVQVPYLGAAFYVWVGIFSTSSIAQFWSYANDLYTRDQGERRFPIIGVGMTVGPVVGSFIAARLFERGHEAFAMLNVASVVLMVSGLLYLVVDRRVATRKSRAAATQPSLGAPTQRAEPAERGGGFALVLRNPYIRMIALMLIVLNIVNTTGEYILSTFVIDHVDALFASGQITDKGAAIGAFYGDFFSVVNLVAFILQSAVVWAIVRYLGIAGVVFALPVVAFFTYGFASFGAGLAIIRWAKTAENSTDYSVMNTAKAMLWLPTSREEKYKAKQAVDTFFVRLGDVLSAGLVFIGVTYLHFDQTDFARLNLLIIVAWFLIALAVVRMYVGLTRVERDSG